ncbi:MAG TPA: hypothetical protein VE010_16690 [Thermoanaerobaculia bacterium]|nr:hypothetical protein [Thermoanaerobaculia bacterium]
MRRVDDPVSGSATAINEYVAGNQVVTISGDRVAIADYSKQELLEIDRAAGTYSVTKFEEIARANESLRPRAGAPADVKVEVKLDRNVMLRRNALEVLIGAAYPNPQAGEHAAVISAARVRESRLQTDATGDVQELYALPVEQVMTLNAGGETVTVRNTVVSVTSDRAPQQLLLIPPGATLVESRLTRIARELRELDQLQ